MTYVYNVMSHNYSTTCIHIVVLDHMHTVHFSPSLKNWYTTFCYDFIQANSKYGQPIETSNSFCLFLKNINAFNMHMNSNNDNIVIVQCSTKIAISMILHRQVILVRGFFITKLLFACISSIGKSYFYQCSNCATEFF